MKKKFLKAIALFSCVCISFSVLASCKKAETEQEETLKPSDTTIETTDKYEDGTHIFDVTETDKDMIKDGVCNYTIVYPAAATANEKIAVEEFSAIFEMATDLKLPAVKDGALTHTASAKYISIGNTSLLASSEIDMELDELGRDGCKVVTKDDTIYIFGGSDGVVYGVYDFMADAFHYEYYYEHCIEIDKNVTNLKLKNYNIKDIPDLEHRWISWRRLSLLDTEEQMIAPYRYRTLYQRGSNMLKIEGMSGVHNSLDVLPPETYKEAHPNWYSNKGSGAKGEGGQLCWSAGCAPSEFANGAIPAEFEAMAQEISKSIQESLQEYLPEKYPEINAVNLGMEDNSKLCGCSACVAWKEKYTSDSAPAVVLMNRVAEITDEWMAQEENEPYRRDMSYLFLAYITFEPAPVKYDEGTDTYVTFDELVKPNENVGVYLAMIRSFEYQLSIHDEMNKGGKTAIDAWTDITDNVYMWLYQTNYEDVFLPYDSFNFFNDAYAYVVSEGAKGLVIQGRTGDNAGSHITWSNLKMYLQSKMLWNLNLDVNELMDNWFKAMFKDGATEMRQMFDEMRVWQTYVLERDDLYMLRSMYMTMYEKEHWPLASLKRWAGLCDEALAKVEKYKDSDPETYEMIRTNIEHEWVSPAYLMLKIYKDDLSSEDKNAIITRFAADIDRFKIITIKENDNLVSDFIGSLS